MMDKDSILILESPTYTNDKLNQKVPGDPVTTEAYCAEQSVTRAEWNTAAQNGLKASYCLVMWADEYHGETTVIYKGNRYGVYRTFRPNSEEIELYLEQKVGVR